MDVSVTLPILSFFVGIFGGLVGAYVGMRVGLARLETWRDSAKDDITGLKKTVAVLEDDSLVHDMEIGDLMIRQGLPRARRQRLRD